MTRPVRQAQRIASRPRLSEQANRARALAQRYHARLRRARERYVGELDEQERAERDQIVLGTIGVLLVFCTWCSVRAVPVIEADVHRSVSRELAREAADRWVQAEVFARDVRLFGIAPSGADRDRIVRAIDELAAVRQVDDRLVVARVPDVPGVTRVASPQGAGGLPRALSLVFDGVRLRMVGEVGDAQTTTALVREAEQRFSAEAVDLELNVTPNSSERWRRAASAAIATLPLLVIAQAVLDGDEEGRLTLTVTGATADATTLSAVRDTLQQQAPSAVALRVDLVHLYRDGVPDPRSCEAALAGLLAATPLRADGDFSGLDRATRLVLDQIAALLGTCRAGLVISAADGADRTFAGDIKAYLVAASVDDKLVAIARRNAPELALKLVF